MSLPVPRIYSPTSPGATVASLSYLYDATGVMVDPYTNVARSTGIFRAIEPFDLGTSIGSVNVSGIDTLIVDTDQLETIETSGVQFLAAISGNGARYALAQGTTTTTNSISGSMSAITTGTALAANANRKEAYIQVVGSGGPLYIALNSTAASASNFNVVLAAATTDIGTNGGIWDTTLYTGPVQISGYIGCRFIAWQSA